MQQGKWKSAIAACAVATSGLLLAPGAAQAVPSFARQTGFACEACHTVFPELTPFGRRFKMNGYTIDNLPQVSGMTPSREQTLALNQLPPLSFMLQTSYTSTKGALPDSNLVPGDFAKNGQVLLPQQASLFYAGKIAPNFGAFVQLTFDGVDDSFGWDNTDVRYAQVANDNLLWGISFNNNPTVQDPWNTTPAWQSPFDQRSSVAPAPGAATLLDGSQFDMSTAGLSAYVYLNNSVYAEIGMYHQANRGFSQIDSAVDQPVIDGLAPYWRVAYERQWGRRSWEVGAYGMVAKVFAPNSVQTGPTDKYSDWAVDSQYQYIGDEHLLTVTGTYIDEKQTLDETFGVLAASANPSNDLKTLRLNASYFYHRKYGAALGYFSTTGSADAGLYQNAVDPVTSYATNNKPDSKGWTAELDWVPYENTKFALQYTMYNKFNGGDANYDGFGRNAKDNDTLYLLGWINF